MRNDVTFGAAIARVRAPILLARAARNGVVLHTTDPSSAPMIRRQISAEFGAAGISARFKVVAHKPSALARRASLESLSRVFGTGDILFDPTGSVGRAAAVMALAGSVREALGDRVRGVLLDGDRLTFFVILDRRRYSDAPETLLGERVEAMRVVAETFGRWRTSAANSMDLALRIGFDLPVGVTLVPVDRRSEYLAKDGKKLFQRLRKPGLAATLASMVGIGSAAQAVAADASMPGVYSLVPPTQGEPAVAAPNIGFIGAGGWVNGDGINNQGFLAGGVKATIPLGQSFGGQLDAAVGSNSYYGVGGHLFWRNPSQGMLGIVGSYESMNTGTLSRFAVEGEIYKNDFTLRGAIGGQSGTTSGAFGSADLVFYATPSFSVSVGGEVGSKSLARGTLEWQPAYATMPGLSLYAQGEVGSNSYSKAMVGLKFYFGTNGATLKDRDRRYDPVFSLYNTGNLAKAGYTAP